MIQTTIIILAGIGAAISAYFAALGLGLVNPQDRRVPRLCRVQEQDCTRLLGSSDARVFGIPNALVGLLYYVALLTVGAQRDALHDLIGFFVLPGLLAVVLGVYLTARLLIVHRVRCLLCLATHCINFILLVIFLMGL